MFLEEFYTMQTKFGKSNPDSFYSGSYQAIDPQACNNCDDGIDGDISLVPDRNPLSYPLGTPAPQ